MTTPTATVLVLGLGNDILGDDAVGLHIASAVRARLADTAGCAVRETTEMGLALLDEIVGCEHLILVDAIETGTAPPGHVHEFDLDALAGRHITAPHFVGVVETLALGRALGLPVPHDAHIFAIEVADALSLGVTLSPDVQSAVATAADRISVRAMRWVGSAVA